MKPVMTHTPCHLHNCDGDADKLRASQLSMRDHYRNKHYGCPLQSRCRTELQCQPSHIVITDPTALALRQKVITESVPYKHPKDFILAADSYTVETFNSAMNVFQDKRISLSAKQHLAQSNLAMCHWNENLDQEFTSVWIPKFDPCAPRREGKITSLAPSTIGTLCGTDT